MDILNFGSINIDHVYQVDHIIRPGETLPSSSYHIHAGGKGANQSVAIVRAGGSVKHAGTIGENGRWLKELLDSSGVDTSLLRVTDEVATGHTIIQVDKSGQNSIILFGGGNNMQDESYIRAVFDSLTGKEVLLIQNEISSLPLILELACDRRLRICMNPAPFTEGLLSLPLNRVEILICNETEAQGLTSSTEASPKVLIEHLCSLYPEVQIILTAGADGVYWNEGSTTYHEPAHPAQVVDTTAAGDTFIGYFLTSLGKDSTLKEAIRIASDAAALAVSREGAMDSIPFSKEMGAR